jgi:hypothetical protein
MANVASRLCDQQPSESVRHGPSALRGQGEPSVESAALQSVLKPTATSMPCDMADVTVPNRALLCTLTNRPALVDWRRLGAEVE